MKITAETLMARANENYRDITGDESAYMHSRQIQALAQAVAEVLEIMQNEANRRMPRLLGTIG